MFSLRNGLLGAFILFPLFTSCGKGEFLTNLDRESKKAIVNTATAIDKGVNDFFETSSKAVSDTNETIKKGLTDAKRETDYFLTESKETVHREGHNGIYNGGKAIEQIGQVPRKIVNDLLGTDADSDENLKDLENQVNEMYQEFWAEFAELSNEMHDMKRELNESDQVLQQAIDSIHTDLLVQIRQGDRRNLRRIRALKNKLRNLRYNVQQIRRYVNNLEVVCDYLNLGFIQLVTYCDLEQDR
jgi:uncharacterized phage infection (PIP) family protein YhgE